MIKLDYSLKTPEERCKLVEQIVAEADKINNRYLEILSDYILGAVDTKDKTMITENRMATIGKRETSFEGLVSQFENGEDGIYELINENNKNSLFKPKIEITEEDIAAIPELQDGVEAIKIWEKKLKTASGKDAYIAKKAIIDLHKDQYLIKSAFKNNVFTRGNGTKIHKALNGKIEIDKNGNCTSWGITLIDPVVISTILCNYEELADSAKLAPPASDLWCLMDEFKKLLKNSLEDYPIYRALVWGKINKLQNQDIQKLLEEEHNVKYSVEYISSLWRNKIPELIADYAEEEYINWYFTFKEKGQYKKCNRCGKTKLAINRYFSKNKASKDGWYSICKECRNKKGKTC